MEYKCSNCDKAFATQSKLNGHLMRVHPDVWKAKINEPDPTDAPVVEPPAAAIVAEKLEVKSEIVAKAKKDSTAYHCIGCGGTLTKGQTPCPTCGAEMDWRQLNG